MTISENYPRVGLLYRGSDLDYAMPLLDLARAAEAHGFSSIFLGEHTHIPVSRESPYLGGGELPEVYSRLLDPYVALSFVAAHTSLRIGTGVALVAGHDPIALAKAIATLDYLSDGRFTFGAGLGWNREEIADHGHSFEDRRAVLCEYLDLMKALWYEDEAEFQGKHASLARSWSWPKPVQRPIPVIMTNESGLIVEDLASGRADGWLTGGNDTEQLAEQLATIRVRWAEAGRPDSGPITLAMVQDTGDDADLRARLIQLEELGVNEVILDIPTDTPKNVLTILDRYAGLLSSS